MTPRATDGDARPAAERAVTLVWMDSREAIVVGWRDGAANIVRLTSDVPPHRRSTGHVRHDPNVRHGGGMAQTAGEPRRLEHLARFVATVAAQLPPGDDLLLLGPGTVHERLARRVRATDAHLRVARDIRSERSSRMTRAQLVARVRRAMGEEPRRHTVGAYRWSPPAGVAADGAPTAGPWRVAQKPARSREEPRED